MQKEMYVLFIVLEFDDNTESVMELCRGTADYLEGVAHAIPALCNSSGKIPVNSYMAMLPAKRFDAAFNNASTPQS